MEFVNVRKAYRLLFLYQTRVMELVQYIGDSLSFEYKGGESLFSNNTPAKDKGRLTNWSWDWLNMYFYEFKFHVKQTNGEQIRFSLLLQSDTGYYDEQPQSEELNIDSFLSAELSETKLIFLIGKNCWHTDFDTKFAQPDSNMFKREHHEYLKTRDCQIFLAHSFPLTDFINLETTQKNLSAWVNKCKSVGILEIEFRDAN